MTAFHGHNLPFRGHRCRLQAATALGALSTSARFFRRLGVGLLPFLFSIAMGSVDLPEMPETPSEIENVLGALTLGGRYYEEEVELFGDVMVPVWNDDATLLFVNPRVTGNDDDRQELNLGLGVRHLSSKVPAIFGANIYYDGRWTTADNRFDQLGLGLEMLTTWIDLRGNYYIPDDARYLVNSYETEEVTTRSSTSRSRHLEYGEVFPSGHAFLQDVRMYERVTTRQTRTTTRRLFEQFESPLEGWDIEAGLKLPGVERWVDTRLFLGYQSFENPFGGALDGLKGRLELRLHDALTLDAEWFENNRLNGSDYMLGARLNLPFDLARLAEGRNPFSRNVDRYQSPSYSGSLAARMSEMVIRDPKVRSTVSNPIENGAGGSVQSRTTSSTQTRNASNDTVTVMSDVQFVDLDNAGDPAMDGSSEHPRDVIQDGVDKTTGKKNVYVFDSPNPYQENVVLADGVQLYGAGTPIVGLGGKQYSATTHPRVVGSQTAPTIMMAENTKVSGLHISNPAKRKVLLGPAGPGLPSPYIPSPNGYKDWYIAETAIASVNHSGISIENNIIEEAQHGIVLIDTLSDAGDRFDFALSHNRIQGLSRFGLVVDARGASGEVSGQLSQNQFLDNGSTGAQIDLQGYHMADLTITGDQALRNDQGYFLNISKISGKTQVRMTGVTADHNEERGIQIARVRGEQGASLLLQNLQASDNQLDGFVLGYSAVEAVAGDVSLTVTDSRFNGNQGSGFEMGGYVQTDTGTARVVFQNLTANDNRAYGIHSGGILSVSRKAGEAYLTLSGINTHYNDKSGVEFNDVMAETYHDSGKVVTLVEHLNATHNGAHGFSAYGEGAYPGAGGGFGSGHYTIRDVNVSDNGGWGWRQSDEGVQSGGDAHFLLDGLTALHNGAGGFYMTAFARSENGSASATVMNLKASYNKTGTRATDLGDGIYMDFGVWAPSGNASLTMKNITAQHNDNDGMRVPSASYIPFSLVGSGTGNATASLQDFTLSDNGASGLRLNRVGAQVTTSGNATFTGLNIRAERNGSYGLNISEPLAETWNGNTSTTLSGELNHNPFYGAWLDDLTKLNGPGSETSDISGLNASGNGIADIHIVNP